MESANATQEITEIARQINVNFLLDSPWIYDIRNVLRNYQMFIFEQIARSCLPYNIESL